MEMFAVCPLRIWKEKQSILQLRCFSDSRDLYLPSFSTERGGSCFGGTGEGPTCLCESSDGETAAGDGKEGSKMQGRKDSGNAKRLQGIKTTCLHTSSTPRRLVLEAAQGWRLLVADS